MLKHKKTLTTNKENLLVVTDNFDQIGKQNFAKLALVALDVLDSNITVKPSIDKYIN